MSNFGGARCGAKELTRFAGGAHYASRRERETNCPGATIRHIEAITKVMQLSMVHQIAWMGIGDN